MNAFDPRADGSVERLFRWIGSGGDSPIERRLGLDRVLTRVLGNTRPPVRCGRYALLEKLGEGGMGIVYRARDARLHRDVAVKVLRSTLGPHASELLRREARAMASVNHPNVVSVYEVGVQDDHLWVAMELVAGPSLAEWAVRHPVRDRAGFERALELLRQAGRGLAAVHAAGLVHRDVKPTNILVGEGARARVSDLGLAFAAADVTPSPPARGVRSSDGAHTRAASVVGSLRYMAPEQQARGEASALADQFAFCVSAWEVLSGAPPFDGRVTESLLDAKRAGPRILPEGRAIPAKIRRALERGLAVRASDRFASMSEVVDALGSKPRTRSIAALGIGLVGALSLGFTIAPDDAGRCAEARAREELAGAADPGRIERLRAVLADAPDSVARGVARSVETFAAEWTRTYVAACEAAWIDETASQAELDARMGCLREALYTVGALTDRTIADATSAPGDVSAAFDGLPTPAQCMSASGPTPGAAADPRVEDALRRRLAEAEADHLLGEHVAAAEAADAIARDAAVAGLNILRARALDRAGASLLARQRYAESIERLLVAYDLAAAERDGWRLAAGIALHLAQAEGGRSHIDAAREWVRHARAALSRGTPAPVELATVPVVECTIDNSGNAYASAEDRCRSALRELQGIEGTEAEHRRWQARVQLAVSLREQGDVAAAEARFQTLHQEIAGRLGPGHPHLGPIEMNLAMTAFAAGSPQRAAAHYRELVDLYERTQEPDDPRLVGAWGGLGSMLYVMGDDEGGGAALEEAIRRGHVRRGQTYFAALGNLALVRRAQGRLDEAIALHLQTLEHSDELGGESLRVASVHQALGATMQQMSRVEEAEGHLLAALQIREKVGAHGLVAASKLTLARLSQVRGDVDRTLQLAREALEILDARAPDHHPEIVDAAGTIATILVDRGRFEDALPYGERCLQALDRSDGRHQAEGRARAHFDLARAHEALGHDEKLREHALEASRWVAGVEAGVEILDPADLEWLAARAR